MRIPFFHSQTLIDALEDGKLDAFLGSEPGPRFAAELNPARIEVPLTEPIVETRQGMAVHKGNLELLAFLNQWVKANRADGWLDEVASHWFDSMRWRRGD
jgi:ABC-type amino acid transport substrate-binding protein